jgi:hypothetical protein
MLSEDPETESIGLKKQTVGSKVRQAGISVRDCQYVDVRYFGTHRFTVLLHIIIHGMKCDVNFENNQPSVSLAEQSTRNLKNRLFKKLV